MEGTPCERACCPGEHTDDEGCELCAFIRYEAPGQMLYRLFQVAAHEHEDPKTKRKRWIMDTAQVDFAFRVLGIVEIERAFELLSRAVTILNTNR